MKNIAQYIESAAAGYAALPVFRAFAEDRIPPERFPAFFREQAMAARHFQDFIWASTDIAGGDELAAFAREHRRVDSGHYKWTEIDLARAGLSPMTLDAHFALEMLPTRIQLARILACFHDADRETRLVILASLEAAGTITLGTLHEYAVRHGFARDLVYLGDAHVKVEARQVAEITKVAAELFSREDARLERVVDTVFDALTRMFEDGGRRIYGALVPANGQSHAA